MKEYETTVKASDDFAEENKEFESAELCEQNISDSKKKKGPTKLFIFLIISICIAAGTAVGAVLYFTKGEPMEPNIPQNEFSSNSDDYLLEKYENTRYAPKFSDYRKIELNNFSSLNHEAYNYREIYKLAEKYTVSLFCFEKNQVMVTSKWASGVVITSDGFIVTNAHVYNGCTNIIAQFADGSEYEVSFVGKDDLTDLAVLKIDADKQFDYAEIGFTNEMNPGDRIFAIGNAGGFDWTYTKGIVSAQGRKIGDTQSPYSISHIQFDASVNTGNSGGPVVNIYGQLVGIVDSKYVANSSEGLGFAISMDEAIPIIKEIVLKGKIETRVKIGITYSHITSERAAITGQVAGLYVEDISSDKPVASCGLQVGDIITKIDDVSIEVESSFHEVFKKKHPNDQIILTVNRDGKEYIFKTTVTKYDD